MTMMGKVISTYVYGKNPTPIPASTRRRNESASPCSGKGVMGAVRAYALARLNSHHPRLPPSRSLFARTRSGWFSPP
jgi:hypothetical protein